MTTLMYHDIVPRGAEDSSGFPGGDAASYKLTPAQFDAHLDAIARRAGVAPPVMTFDDGGDSARSAADALARRRRSRRGRRLHDALHIGADAHGLVDRRAVGVRPLHDSAMDEPTDRRRARGGRALPGLASDDAVAAETIRQTARRPEVSPVATARARARRRESLWRSDVKVFLSSRHDIPFAR